MQIKTTMRYHLTPVRMAIIKKVVKTTPTKAGKVEGKVVDSKGEWKDRC